MYKLENREDMEKGIPVKHNRMPPRLIQPSVFLRMRKSPAKQGEKALRTE
jgi:hypothetical protein